MSKQTRKFIGNYEYERVCKFADKVGGEVTKTWDNWGQTIWIVTWYE